MNPRFSALLISFFLFSASVAWSKNQSDTAYPHYEPTAVEDLPVAAPSEAAPAINPKNGNSNATPPAEAPASAEPPAEALAPAASEAAPPLNQEPAASEAATPTPKPAAKQAVYRVWIWQENGDSLSKIAQKVYGDKTKWQLIYLANKDIIKDPNKIYPKQKLKIPPPDWQPNP